MPTPRPLLSAEISGRDGAGGLRLVSPRDFTTGDWRMVEADALPAGFVPYCLDGANRRSVYARAGSIQHLCRAKFQYVHLRDRATRLVSAPWERGRLTKGPAPPAVFVFSVGRCGSTLLFELTRSAGILSLSEPDFYTQGVAARIHGPPDPLYASLQGTLRDLTEDLLVVCAEGAAGPGLVKLRAQCCRAPALIVGTDASRSASLFLVRRFESWATSMLRATTLTPARIVVRYVEGLNCLRWLRAHTACLVITYENLVAQPAATVETIARELGLAVETSRLARAAKRDSQLGTPLARGTMQARKVDQRALAECLALWVTAKPRELIGEVGLTDYA